MKKLTKWILLMDGTKAKILKKDSSGFYKHVYGTEHLEEFSHQKKVFNHNLASLRQHGADCGTHHIFPIDQKPKTLDMENFVKKIAIFLNQNKQLFDKIVLVVPEHILGYLRANFHNEVQEKIYQEVRKDLIKIPLSEYNSKKFNKRFGYVF